MEVADVAKSFVQSCTLQPSHEDSTASSSFAQRQLDVLNGLVGSRDLAFFASRSRLAHECITCCITILLEVQPNLQLSGKVLTLLQHLAKKPQLLEWLREEFELHSALVEFFQSGAIEDNFQLRLQVIQLLRELCYRHEVTLTESKLGYLSDFLFKQMDSGDDELFLPCLELLNHLSWSTHAQKYMKIMPQLPELCRSLVPKTTYDNSCVVMHTLAIFANLSLDQFISNKMFSQSIKQTLQVLLCTVVSNNLEARRIATDILEDLLNNQERRACMLKYHKMMVSCASKVAEKKVQRESEDLRATINFLAVILSVPELLEEYVARTPSTIEPLLSLLVAAVEESVGSLDVVHTSVRLVTLLTKDMCAQNLLVAHNAPVSEFLKAVTVVLVALQDKEVDGLYFAPEMCLASLRLFRALTDSGICGETIIKQCLTVEHIRALLKPYLAKDPQCVQDACTNKQVEVVTACLDFLRQLMNKLENAEECLQQLLQEPVTASYLSIALCLTKENVVMPAFNLTVMANFQQDFSREKFVQSLVSVNRKRKALESPAKRDKPPAPVLVAGTMPRAGAPVNNHNRRLSVENSIERISRRLEQSFEMGDLKQSEILAVYENKIFKLKAREEELLQLLEAKTAALQQSDRLVTKYTCIEAKNEAEVEELRSLLRASERRIEDTEERMTEMEKHTEETVQSLKASRTKIKALKAHVEELEQRNNDLDVKAKRHEVVLKSLESAQQEIMSQKEMIAMLQKHGDSMKLKLEALTKANEELELANQDQEKLLKEHEAKMKDQAKCLHKLQGNLDEKMALVKALKTELKSINEASIALQKENSALEQQVQALEAKYQKKDEALQNKTNQLAKVSADLEKLKKMQEMIQSISAGIL
ncbi:protein CIP2A homolog [Dermacentor albipictus]|uniref:protein CIP2A homolog n=1 Tax=Dermacentor albipictus TaxID=60249 RepID=UPI0038FC4DAF